MNPEQKREIAVVHGEPRSNNPALTPVAHQDRITNQLSDESDNGIPKTRRAIRVCGRETCEYCQRSISREEQAYVLDGKIACEQCDKNLRVRNRVDSNEAGIEQLAPVINQEHAAPTEAKARKQPFFSIPGNAHVPKLVRFYGAFIAGLCIGYMIFFGVAIFGRLALGYAPTPVGVIYIVLVVLLYRLGRGLGNGERMSVYGLCVLGAMICLLVVGDILSGNCPVAAGLLCLGFAAIFWIPPTFVAVRHWDLFGPGGVHVHQCRSEDANRISAQETEL